MKKVLLLGDSIRMSYQSLVKEILAGKAEVYWPDDNCRFAKYTLWSVNWWIEQCGKPDIIHWNNGIWDIFRLNEDIGIFTAIDTYAFDIQRVLNELKKTNAQIIWATTTAVDDRCPTCRNQDIDAYNQAAVEIMRREGVPVDDLNALVRSNIGLFIADDHFHLTKEGEGVCAEAVSESVMEYIW